MTGSGLTSFDLPFDSAKVGFFIFICVIPKKMRNFVVSKQDYSP
jgi:hypothetical protein